METNSESHNISEILNSNDLLENSVSFNNHVSVHVSSFQRPSTVDCQVGMHVLNNSFDFHEYENSLHVNMVNMACHNNQSGERSINVGTFSFENLHSSTHEPQQVTYSQVTQHDTLFSGISTGENESLSVGEETQHVSVTSKSVLNVGFKDKGFRIGHLNIQGIRNKVEQLKLLLQSEQNLIHILGVSETK